MKLLRDAGRQLRPGFFGLRHLCRLILRSPRPTGTTPTPATAAPVLRSLRGRDAAEQRLDRRAHFLLHQVTDHRQQALPSRHRIPLPAADIRMPDHQQREACEPASGEACWRSVASGAADRAARTGSHRPAVPEFSRALKSASERRAGRETLQVHSVPMCRCATSTPPVGTGSEEPLLPTARGFGGHASPLQPRCDRLPKVRATRVLRRRLLIRDKEVKRGMPIIGGIPSLRTALGEHYKLFGWSRWRTLHGEEPLAPLSSPELSSRRSEAFTRT
jgi:hypothetical protein